MEKVKVAVYRRTATNNEQQLKDQEAMLKKYCEEKGYELVGTYSDIGVSSTNTNRPAYQQMMSDIKDNKFNTIVTDDPSRISRNVVEFLEFIMKLDKQNCEFETIDGCNYSNDEWIKHWANKLSVSQLERVMHNYE